MKLNFLCFGSGCSKPQYIFVVRLESTTILFNHLALSVFTLSQKRYITRPMYNALLIREVDMNQLLP